MARITNAAAEAVDVNAMVESVDVDGVVQRIDVAAHIVHAGLNHQPEILQPPAPLAFALKAFPP